MSNAAIQLQKMSNVPTAAAARVVFDEVVFSSGDVSYDPNGGIVTVNEPGRYIVTWWAAVQSSPSSRGLRLGIVSNIPSNDQSTAQTYTNQIFGSTILETQAVPFIFSLVNLNEEIFYISSAGVVAPVAGLVMFNSAQNAPIAYGGLYDNATLVVTLDPDTEFQVPMEEFMPADSVSYGANTIIIESSGVYSVRYLFAGQSTGGSFPLDVGVRVNGVLQDSLLFSTTYDSEIIPINVEAIVTLNAGDIVDLVLYSLIGGSILGAPRLNVSLSVNKLNE